MTSKTLDLTNISVIWPTILGALLRKNERKIKILDHHRFHTANYTWRFLGDSPTGWIGVAKSPRTVHEETEDFFQSFPLNPCSDMFQKQNTCNLSIFFYQTSANMIPTNQVVSPSFCYQTLGPLGPSPKPWVSIQTNGRMTCMIWYTLYFRKPPYGPYGENHGTISGGFSLANGADRVMSSFRSKVSGPPLAGMPNPFGYQPMQLPQAGLISDVKCRCVGS